jgi:large subunit ribosomal protein L5
MAVTLKEKYDTEVAPQLREALGIKNVRRTPKLEKVVVNMGLGTADRDELKAHAEELAAITGQRPAMTKARNSIANFRLREGMTIGARVTLRGTRMYEFLDRMISAALPRIRDFRGLQPTSFDGRGNYTMGVREQTIFPEIDPDNVSGPQGMDITIVTSTDSDDEARELLKLMGMPFAEHKDGSSTIG